MPSPFPGMNPFIERASVWHDFHVSWIALVAELIGAQVLPRYFVRIEQHRYIHDLIADEPRFIGHGDVPLPTLTPPGMAAADGETLQAPAEVGVPEVDIESQSSLAIRDCDNNELLTVIELLSPVNKFASCDREQYLAKVRHLRRSQVHFVEIDLLRGGPRMPWLEMGACDYCVVVSRKQRPRAGFWPVHLRERLPEIPVPLQAGDKEARIDLQEILHRIYDRAGYRYYIYSGPPEPLLSEDDAAWAQQFVPAAGPVPSRESAGGTATSIG